MARAVSAGEEAGGMPDGISEGNRFLYSESSSSMRISSFVCLHFRMASRRMAFAFLNSFLLDRMVDACFFICPTL